MFVLWLLLGLGVGFLGAWITKKVLPAALGGNSMIAPVIIGGKLFLHLGVLTMTALISRSALLWTAGGDVVALLGFTAFEYYRRRKQ